MMHFDITATQFHVQPRNKEETSLHHVAIVAKFPDLTKPWSCNRELQQQQQRRLRKRQLKSVLALLHTLSHLFHLVQFVKCWRIFSGVEFWRTVYQSLEKEKEGRSLVFTSFTKRKISQFHVVVMQRRQINVQKAWCRCEVFGSAY